MTFKQFYFDVIMRRKEQKESLKGVETSEKRSNKLTIDTYVLHENDLSIAS